MQPQPSKSLGQALIDVFDAALTLIKAEIRSVTQHIGKIIKAKALGVVLLLAALTPLCLALIFLLLSVFFALTLVFQTWAAALIVALLALVVTALLIWLGLRALSLEDDNSEKISSRLDTSIHNEGVNDV